MYRKDKRYIAGAVITAASVVIISVTFIMMGIGSNKAIVWFYFSLPALVIGLFVMQSTKRMYERADIDGTSPLPYFYYFKVLTAKVKKCGVLNTAVRVLICTVTVAVAVCAAVIGYYSYNISALRHQPQYVYNETRYNEYYNMWKQALSDGDEEQAHSIFETMEQYHSDNAGSDKRINEYKENRNGATVFGIIAVTADTVLVAGYLIYQKAAKGKRKHK